MGFYETERIPRSRRWTTFTEQDEFLEIAAVGSDERRFIFGEGTLRNRTNWVRGIADVTKQNEFPDASLDHFTERNEIP